MTDRERFRRVMTYEPVDRPPVMALEPYEAEALDRWRREGLPEGADVVAHLGMAWLQWLPCWYGPIPGFDLRVLVDHPVKTRADWEQYKQRFLPRPDRLPPNWAGEVAPALNASDQPVALLLFPFYFRTGFYGMGMERFLSAFHEEPDLMHDIFAHYTEMVVATIRPALQHAQVDIAVIAEDYAGKNGPLISPRKYREFWIPHQARVLQVLRAFHVPLVCQWTAGRFHELIPVERLQGMRC